ncbi:hypothetical protein EDD18DRAFT_1116420 [Armillaria luteobubalina]|uniref:Uncharacterized protein n=1 Tax=Armillaria luteobubalina TaxID=153913 RepID=A0AA39NZD4_9AGAR|nr:hypothetical protein EDD18DRAFT_1116420 [Armillaria luteobubalina]
MSKWDMLSLILDYLCMLLPLGKASTSTNGSISEMLLFCLQVWRELLAMPFKKEHTKTTKAHDTMLDMMGTVLQMSGPDVRNPTTHTDQPFDDNWGCYLVWELCELNFQLELLALDMHLTHSLVSDSADFQLKRQSAILNLFPGESLVPLPSHSVTSLVPLVFEAKGLLDPSGDETSLGVEKALVKHYVQTFFDSFERTDKSIGEVGNRKIDR